MSYSEQDAEMWDTDPYEYIRVKFDIFEVRQGHFLFLLQCSRSAWTPTIFPRIRVCVGGVQCFGSRWIRIQIAAWIWIRIRYTDPDPARDIELLKKSTIKANF